MALVERDTPTQRLNESSSPVVVDQLVAHAADAGPLDFGVPSHEFRSGPCDLACSLADDVDVANDGILRLEVSFQRSSIIQIRGVGLDAADRVENMLKLVEIAVLGVVAAQRRAEHAWAQDTVPRHQFAQFSSVDFQRL